MEDAKSLEGSENKLRTTERRRYRLAQAFVEHDTYEDRKERESECNRTYYAINKEKINARKKERYATDPEYRNKIIKASKERSKRIERRSRKKRTNFKIFKIDVGGKEVAVKMYSIVQLAKTMDRKPATIRMWERTGILPPAIYRTCDGLNGIRLYTEFQIKSIIRIFRETFEENSVQVMTYRIGQTKFSERVRQLWIDFPLGIDPNNLEETQE